MKLLVYSAKEYEIPFLAAANNNKYRVSYLQEALDTNTAIKAVGFDAISIFSGDDASLLVLEKLRELGVRYITLRSAGYNNIYIKAAKQLGLKVANTPEYSPNAIAELAIGLLLALNRKIIPANDRVHSYNFLQDGLVGFDLNNKTAGIIGTGKIGSVMVKIMHGFGCKILACDINPNNVLVQKYNVNYVNLEELCTGSDMISLHVPLTGETHYMIRDIQFRKMKKNVILVNTARGAVVDTKALLLALEKDMIGAYGTDVYEKERGSFFQDHSKDGIKDPHLVKLLSYPNVLLTPHQGFVTKEALTNIAATTFYNLDCWTRDIVCKNELGYEAISS
ncbi:MAG TPA: 2-hydroxyacid dehydrogenase [Eudoraea sp.]|nr:2-hydroxyacid dehydrogenase [Eudoraea sp.]